MKKRLHKRRRILPWVLLAVIVSPVLLVLALRWLPVPITSFMLQSPTHPVQHDWVPRTKIADVARKAVVAAEDQKFWNHDGFDFEAMQEAYEKNQKSRRKRGGSTISQQTAKNLFLWSGGGYLRKGIEAGFTVLIEKLWDKPRILEVYLNIAEFGPGIYGVEAASQHFFRKPASQLSASEAARLASVLPSPRRWKVDAPGPYVQTRTAWILRQMGYGGGPRMEDEEPIAPPGELPPDDMTYEELPSPRYQYREEAPTLQSDDEPGHSSTAPQTAPLETESESQPVPVPAEPAPQEAPLPQVENPG